MKTLSPEHIELVRGVLDARAMLRGLLPKLPAQYQQTVARALNCMGCALKARGASTAKSGDNRQQSASENTPRRQTIFRPGTPVEGIPIAQLPQLQPPKTKGANAEGK